MSTTRRGLAFAATGFAALVIYASLVPRSEQPISARDAFALLVASWPPPVTSKSDVLANLMLQCPFGFLLAGAIAHRHPRRQAAAVLLATAAAAALAFSIELAQGMFSARTPSTSDVLAESVGSLTGALLWMLGGERVSEFATDGWRELGSPALFLLGSYSILWTLWQWLPFDFTLRLAELAHKYRAGLATLLPQAGDAADALLTLRSAARQWLLACPIGVAAWLLTRRQRRRRTDTAILVGCGFTLGVYAAGLLTESGSIDLAAIGAAGLGAASGAWWAERPGGSRDYAIAVPAIAALLIDQWAPFRFTMEPQSFAWLPLLSYLRASAPDAIGEALLKLQLGFAAAFAAGVFRASAQFGWSSLFAWIAGCAVVEFGQVFLSGRFADVTDVILLSIGAAMGLFVRAVFRRERAAPVR